MRRNMDLVREILLELEKCPFTGGRKDIRPEGYTAEEVSYEIKILAEAGLIEADNLTSMGSSHPDWRAKELTWEGHEFLDNSRDLAWWQKAKALVREQGKPLTVEALKLAFTELLKRGLSSI